MYSCIIGLPVYNAAKYIPFAISNISILKTLFNKVHIVFAYDDSNDNTINLLNNYAKNNNDVSIIIISKHNKNKSKYRTVNISRARNVILNFIRSQREPFDFFIMLDCNYNNYMTIDKNVLSLYLDRTDWDALSFNQNDYYDIWALSIFPYYLSCWAWSSGAAVSNTMKKYITNKLANCSHEKLVPCISAFNGISIYRSSKFLNCFYNGYYNTYLLSYLHCNLKLNISLLKNVSQTLIKNNYVGKNSILGNQDCEHRSFHAMAIIKNNAKICISPLCLFKN